MSWFTPTEGEKMLSHSQADFKKQSLDLDYVRGIFLENRADWPTLNLMLKQMNRDVIEEETMALENIVDLLVYGVPKNCGCGGEVRYSEKHHTYLCSRNPLLYNVSVASTSGGSNQHCSFAHSNPIRYPFEMPEQFKQQLSWFPVNKRSEFTYRAYDYGDVRRECQSAGGRMMMKRGTVVDGQIPEASTCHLLKGDDGGLCSAVLVYCDVRGDTNNFMKLELYEHDVDKIAYFYVTSGRIGAKTCIVERDTNEERDQAVNLFEKHFLEYTGNEWKNRMAFHRHPGMMMYLEMDYSSCINQLHAQLGVDGKILHPDVRNLVETIYASHPTAVRIASFTLDIETIPLGPVAKDHITEALKVLSDLEQLLDASKPNMDKVFEASSLFYTLFPTSFGEEPMRPIDSFEILVEKSSLLHALDDIKYEFVISEPPPNTTASTSSLRNHPYYQYNESYAVKRRRKATAGMTTEQLYKALRCDIQVVDRYSDEFRQIQTYLLNTGYSSGLQLVELFRLKRDSELVTFRSSIGNRLLLWHGSGIVNLPSILSEGLKVTPPRGVLRCGLDFGQGVYFADTADLSQGYCRATQGFDLFLLLSDVALGRIQFTDGTNQDDPQRNVNFDSFLGGSGTLAEPSKVIQHPDGYGIPVHTKRQSYPNEYIVFNSDQVKLKYLVRARSWKGGHDEDDEEQDEI